MPSLRIEVVYALAETQDVVLLQLPDGAHAGEAVAASGLAKRYGLAEDGWTLGIGGRPTPPHPWICGRGPPAKLRAPAGGPQGNPRPRPPSKQRGQPPRPRLLSPGPC